MLSWNSAFHFSALHPLIKRKEKQKINKIVDQFFVKIQKKKQIAELSALGILNNSMYDVD